MSMSEARCAMPSSRMRAPSLTSAIDQPLDDLVVADLARRDAVAARSSMISSSTTAIGIGVAVARLRSGTSRRRSSGRSGRPRTACRRRWASARLPALGVACACGWPSRCPARPGRPCGTGPSRSRTSRSAPSICCGSAPSSIRTSACRAVAREHAVADEAVADARDHRDLLDLLGQRHAVASTSGAVFAPRTTSSSLITLAGLKKCRPITSCGRLVKPAILSTSSVEVLEARIAPGLQTCVERLEHLSS